MESNTLNNGEIRFIQVLFMRGLLFFLLCLPISAWANVRVDGMIIPDKSVLEGQLLALNGAGVRSIVFFDIYLVSLYLAHPSNDANVIIQNSRPAQLRMEFLHGGAGHNMLANGWRKGFEHNQTTKTMYALEGRLEKFSSLFGDVQKGEVFVFDFLLNGDTRINFDGHTQGVIHGADFQQALLAIWLGKHPVGDTLKKELLHNKSINGKGAS